MQKTSEYWKGEMEYQPGGNSLDEEGPEELDDYVEDDFEEGEDFEGQMEAAEQRRKEEREEEEVREFTSANKTVGKRASTGRPISATYVLSHSKSTTTAAGGAAAVPTAKVGDSAHV